MPSTTSIHIITALKTIFSTFGIPEIVRIDNGPQYRSQEFSTFAKACNFTHVTSSPLHPQSNGQIERTVQILKKILQQTDDVCQGLHIYHTIPMPWCNLSPSELLMGLRLRFLLPMTENLLTPQWPYLSEFQKPDKRKISIGVTVQRNNLHCDVWVTSSREPVRGRIVTATNTI